MQNSKYRLYLLFYEAGGFSQTGNQTLRQALEMLDLPFINDTYSLLWSDPLCLVSELSSRWTFVCEALTSSRTACLV